MWLLAVLTCVAVYRVTRMLVEDKITESLRNRFILWSFKRAYRGVPPTEWKDRPEPLLAYFATCPWCTSVWLGGLIVLVEVLTLPHVPYPLLLWAASSATAGFLAGKE